MATIADVMGWTEASADTSRPASRHDALDAAHARLGIQPDAPCYTVLPSGAVCGHSFARHFGRGGACIAGSRSGEASVCACLGYTAKDDAGASDGDRP